MNRFTRRCAWLVGLVLLWPGLSQGQIAASADRIIFESSGQTETRAVALINHGSTAVGLTSLGFEFGDGLGFEATDGCSDTTLLAAGDLCQVSFSFDPTSKGRRHARYAWRTDQGQRIVVWLSNSHEETSQTQAARRHPPVLADVQLLALASDGTESIVETAFIQSGTPYRLRWTVSTTLPTTLSGAALFDCGPSGSAEPGCGGRVDDRVQASQLLEGSFLNEAERITANLPEFRFGNAPATYLVYQYDFNIDSLDPTGPRDLVLRFYHADTRDSENGERAVSLLAPAGLSLLGSDVVSTLDSLGRRLRLPVRPASIP